MYCFHSSTERVRFTIEQVREIQTCGSRSQSIAVLSLVADAKLSIGAERNASHPFRVTVQWLAERWARRQVPEPHRLVRARRGQQLAVRAERNADDRIRVTYQRRF